MRWERWRAAQFAGAVTLAASAALSAACGGSSDPTVVTAPTGTVVTDTFNGVTTTLGTLTGTTSAYAYHTYTYSHTISVPATGCKSYTNTATTGLTGAGQSSSQTVQVCGPAKTGPPAG